MYEFFPSLLKVRFRKKCFVSTSFIFFIKKIQRNNFEREFAFLYRSHDLLRGFPINFFFLFLLRFIFPTMDQIAEGLHTVVEHYG